MEQSLEDKVGEMNGLGFEIFDDILKGDQEPLTEEEGNVLFPVVDGLAEGYVMMHIEGRCSLQAMLDNTPEVLEKYVDDKISFLKALKSRLEALCLQG